MSIKTAFAIASLPVLAITPILHAQSTTQTAQAPSPADALQGTWEGEEIGGESQGKWTMTITGNTLRLDGPDKVEWYMATFTLPANQTPNQLQATITDCPQPKYVGKSSMAIYKIEDGKLTLVGNRPGVLEVPKDFDGDAASRRFVFKKS